LRRAGARTRALADVRAGEEVCGTVREAARRRCVPTTVIDHWSTTKPAYRATPADDTLLVASGGPRLPTGRGGGVGRAPRGGEGALFAITPGTGDFVANGVVSHNCFARPTHTYLDLDADRDFERRIVVKVNAVSRLGKEPDPRRWTGELIAMGTNTDPYQRAEGKYRLTRGIVELLAEHANPFSILTKATLVLRDLELLAEAARRTDVRVNLSIGTLDEA